MSIGSVPQDAAGDNPCVVVATPNGEFRFHPHDLLEDDELVRELEEVVRAAESPAIFVLQHLLIFLSDARWNLFQFVTDASNPCQFAPASDAEPTSDLFVVVLALLVGVEDIDLCIRGRQAAIEAAVLVHPSGLDIAASRLAARLRELGVRGVRADTILRDMRQLELALSRTEHDEDDEAGPWPDEYLQEAVDDAPAPGGALVPSGWIVTTDGVSRAARGDLPVEPVTHCPVVLSRRHIHITEATELLEIGWTRDGVWRTKIVHRSTLADVRAIITLADHGLPVNAINARTLVEYLAEFEAINQDVIPTEMITSKLGWHGREAEEVFVLGNRSILAEETPDAAESAGQRLIRFHPADGGDEQIAAGFHRGGSFEGWLAAVSLAQAFPKLLLAFYASFAAVLLRIFETPNFVVSFDGPSTLGKTTALIVGASVWGNPDARSAASIVSTWNATRVRRGRVCSLLGDLPFFNDDTRLARFANEVGQTVYDVVSGRDRGRGTRTGSARTGVWHTVMVTTGEQPITAFSPDDGLRPRILMCWGSPFGDVDERTGRIASQLTQQLSANYGHAGVRFLEYLLEHRCRWDDWRGEFQQRVEHYQQLAEDDRVAHRMATSFAAVDMAARLAHEALSLPWDRQDPITPLWEELTGEAAEADPAARALEAAVDWARRHPQEFFELGGRGLHAGTQPPNGWAGRWLHPEGHEAAAVAYFPGKLKEILQQSGFDPEATLRSWRDRGWVHVDRNGRTRRRMRVANENPYLVQILHSAIELIDQ